LFRHAFALTLENGGRFAPTLERLARVARDREILMRTARVSTTTMRMTANVLLVIAPLVILMIAVRMENYWGSVIHHPVANTLASIGFTVIIGSYLLLRKMSSFRP